MPCHQFHEAIRDFRAKPANLLAHSWDDLSPTRPDGRSERVFSQRLEGSTLAEAPRRRYRAQGFSQQDLKELRKAIKAKDKKRIAELTSKIGIPSVDET
jgi:hypothetical protein